MRRASVSRGLCLTVLIAVRIVLFAWVDNNCSHGSVSMLFHSSLPKGFSVKCYSQFEESWNSPLGTQAAEPQPEQAGWAALIRQP